jgi:hypothetical protein
MMKPFEPDESSRSHPETWERFARLQQVGTEVTGRVIAGGDGALRVELAPGFVGTLRYRHSFARPLDLRDFVVAHRPGQSIRVRIRRLAEATQECELRLADALARQWLEPRGRRTN